MKVLHLAAGNRWTGAAAPAFAEAAALRDAGADAHYAYVGGYKLEAKIGALDWTHAAIRKSQDPVSFLRSASAVRRLVREQGIELLHAHLTYDDSLSRFAARGGIPLARTFHSSRVLRNDLVSRALLARIDLVFVVNEAFRRAPLLRGRTVFFTPPPVDRAQFSPGGPSARSLHGIPEEAKLITVIGKVAPGRGFEEAMRTFAVLRRLTPGVKMMIIGFGPHRPFLEGLASELGITTDLTWAGYHEELLADHYRASDLMLFTAPGSDEGHRAVLEALSCGVPVASYPIDGVDALLPAGAIAPAASAEALAATAVTLLARDRSASRAEASAAAEGFGYPRAARRLLDAYASLGASK